MYMPLEVLAVLATAALWRAYASSGYAWWVAYGATLASAAYVSYYAILLLIAHAAWLLAQRPCAGSVTRVGTAAATALLLYAPWLSYLAHPVALARGSLLQLRGQGLWPSYIPELLASQTFGGYLFNMLAYQTSQGLGLQYYGLLLFPFVVLIAAGAVALGDINRPARALIAYCWGVPVIAVVASSLALGWITAYAFHLNFLQPFLALFVGAGVVHLREVIVRVPGRLVTLLATLAILAFAAPAITNLQWNPEYQSYRYDSAARLVRNLFARGDAVIYLPQGVRRGFSFYFDPPGKELGVTVDPRRWSREAVAAEIERTVAALEPGDLRVWIVYSSPLPKGSGQDLVDAIERRGFRSAIFHDYKGLGVGLLVRPLK
jgi:hypothetical protein